jgi:hypothetical protein
MLIPVGQSDGDAIPGVGVPDHLLHVLAEMDVLLTSLAEPYASIAGRIKILP